MQIAYIHGFLSGSQAVKSRILKKFLENHHPHLDFLAPDFPDTPQEAYEELCRFTRSALEYGELGLVGSSMGGFMSTLLSIKFGVKAVLLNPCIHPQDYFEKLIGPNQNPFTKTQFVLDRQMLDYVEQKDREAQAFDPELLSVWLQQGDEVLDYTKAEKFFAKARPHVIAGGQHAFADFESYLPKMIEFLTDSK